MDRGGRDSDRKHRIITATLALAGNVHRLNEIPTKKESPTGMSNCPSFRLCKLGGKSPARCSLHTPEILV